MVAPASGPKDASPITAAVNRAVLDALPFADTQDFDDARRGLLATLPEIEIKNDQGRVVWSLRNYAFLADEHAPATVNPSLGRLARLNLNHGLFQVTDHAHRQGADRDAPHRWDRDRVPAHARGRGVPAGRARAAARRARDRRARAREPRRGPGDEPRPLLAAWSCVR